jgi:hypothetical protein
MPRLPASIVLAAALPLAACARAPEPAPVPVAAPASAPAPATSPASAPAGTAPTAAQPAPAIDPALPHVVVHKNASCGCCLLWVEHMQQAGFAVEVRNVDNLEPVKTRVGVPAGKGSCHTAEVGGYFVEGHVPAEDVKRLLAERPDAKGLTVPGMPLGSPGMEVPDGRVQPYTAELVHADGSTSAFARHGR